MFKVRIKVYFPIMFGYKSSASSRCPALLGLQTLHFAEKETSLLLPVDSHTAAGFLNKALSLSKIVLNKTTSMQVFRQSATLFDLDGLLLMRPDF